MRFDQILRRQRLSVLWFGVLVALLLAFGLSYVLINDRSNRIAFAQRQVLSAASAVERLLRAEFHNLERAMRGVAHDGEQATHSGSRLAQDVFGASLDDFVNRYDEIESVVVVDRQGAALTPGRGDPEFSRWAAQAAADDSHGLSVGPLERSEEHGWVLRLALRMSADRWLLARMRTEQLQHMVSMVDLGEDSVLAVVRSDGELIARDPDPSLIGSQLPLVAGWDAAGPRAAAQGIRRSRIDGHWRIAATSVLREYPGLVFAAINFDQVIAPWWRFLFASVLLYLIYCLGLIYLLYTLSRADRLHNQLLGELRTGNEELRLAYQVSGVGTWWLGQGAEDLYWSQQTMTMLGFPDSVMTVARFLRLVHPQDRRRVLRSVVLALSRKRAFDLAFRLLLPGQSERWIGMRGAMVEGANERLMTGTILDVSERVETQALAADAQRQFRLIFEINPLPCWLFDKETLRFLEVNPAAIRQYGYSRGQFLGMQITDICHPDRVEDIKRRIHLQVESEREAALLTVHRLSDGSLIDVRVHASWLRLAGTDVWVVLAENVSEYMAYQRELAHRASHDSATGLLNVSALVQRLSGADMRRYSIAHVQLRGLQLIGDTLGRKVGEEVLRNLCERLQTLADECGWLAFQPSEDFVLAISGEHDPRPAIEVLVAMLSEPVRGRDSLHPLEVRIGVAEFPRDGTRTEEVVAQAAQAAHAAREAGVTVMHFDRKIAARLSQRLRLTGQLHEAIDSSDFELYYQPVFDARGNEPVALEALIRWRSPERGPIPPDDFIRLCEDTGLILPLGRWAIRQGARDRRRLVEAGWTELPIAINVSGLQLLNTDVADEVAAACGECGLAPGALHIELTESSLVRDPQQVLQTMQRLHAQGSRVSLDDFGTGFSSMSYLRHMPLDSLKIDRSFIFDVDRNTRSAVICRALIALGHNLGLKVIAEGVERADQRAWLVANGCDQLQGFLLARPAPFDVVIGRLLGGFGAFGKAAR